MAKSSFRWRRLALVVACVAVAGLFASNHSADTSCRLQFRDRTDVPLSNVRLSVSGKESTQAVLSAGENFTIPVDDADDLRVTYYFTGPDGAVVTGNVGFAGGKRPWKHGLLVVTVNKGMVVQFDVAEPRRDVIETVTRWFKRFL